MVGRRYRKGEETDEEVFHSLNEDLDKDVTLFNISMCGDGGAGRLSLI